MRRRSLLALGALLPGAVLAQPHWLVGTWQGEIQGGSGGREGPQRVLVVRSVAADGTVTGSWSVRGESAGGDSQIKLSGETLSITTARGASVSLARSGPDTLAGQAASVGGRPRPLTMTRQR